MKPEPTLSQFRQIRMDALVTTAKHFQSCQASSTDPQDQYIKTNYWIVWELPEADENGKTYEIIDSNHRFEV